MNFVKQNDSAYNYCGDNPEKISKLVADAFCERNPEKKLVFHVRPHGALKCDNYNYILDFEKIFPEAEYGKVVYALGIQYADNDTQAYYMCRCKCPVRVFVNGEKIWQSSIIEETNFNAYKKFFLPLKKGINYILVEVQKVRSGFGCVFGSGESKWTPHMIFMPGHDREFEEGYAYTAPIDKVEDIASVPLGESDGIFEWFPKCEQSLPDSSCVIWTKAAQNTVVSVSQCGASAAYVNAIKTDEDVLYLQANDHLTMVFENDADLSFVDENFVAPYDVKGNKGRFFFQNVKAEQAELIASNPAIDIFYGNSYWQSTVPGGYIRPALETEYFGKWNYTVGVTLTGLLAYGKRFEKSDIVEYSLRHINETTKLYKYMKWDYQFFGSTNFNQLLTDIVMLDDCGSCGSAMMEAANYGKVTDKEILRDDIYDFMVNKHHKTDDGIFVRGKEYFFMENSIWADDMYMSIPFLCRYYKDTENSEALDFAVKQALLYKKYLFMNEENIMAHVYNTSFAASNGLAWGRGNGWAAYSLSELLQVLPKDNEKYNEVCGFFCELCKGLLNYQDKSGMWHQLVNDCDSYEETSCTCMFICAFLRGYRMELLGEEFCSAALKAWKAICNKYIDKHGNVYGVCRGSGYSFSPDYYKYELLTNKNDLHGVGIVLLAACEVAGENFRRK